MGVFKQLAKGELSLAVTFWGFLVLGSVILSAIGQEMFAVMAYYSMQTRTILMTSLFIIKFILVLLVTLGIFFMLRNKKITFWRVVAFIISTINLAYSGFTMLVAVCVSYEILTQV